MRTLSILLLVGAVVLAATMAYVRFAPTDAGRWHTDPSRAGPGPDRYVVGPDGGDESGPLLDVPPIEALKRLDAVARDTPRTRHVAGSPEEGRITYVTRSALWGFPDYTTVSAVEVEGGTRFVIFARQRFGKYDWGVNGARVRNWLARVSG